MPKPTWNLKLDPAEYSFPELPLYWIAYNIPGAEGLKGWLKNARHKRREAILATGYVTGEGALNKLYEIAAEHPEWLAAYRAVQRMTS